MSGRKSLKHLALEQLSHSKNWNSNTIMLRGIGYALLELADAIRESH